MCKGLKSVIGHLIFYFQQIYSFSLCTNVALLNCCVIAYGGLGFVQVGSPDHEGQYEPVDQDYDPPPLSAHQTQVQSAQQRSKIPERRRSSTLPQPPVAQEEQPNHRSGESTASDEAEHVYESIHITTMEKPTEYAKLTSFDLPDDLESLADISSDYLANVDPRKAQLWMLLQMQKMVQKIENVYETVGYYTRPLQPQPPEALQKDPLKVEVEDLRSRRQHYVNLSTISEAVSQIEKPLPPMPPKTYKDQEAKNEVGQSEVADETKKHCSQAQPVTQKSSTKFQPPHPYSMLKGSGKTPAANGQVKEVPQQDIIGEQIDRHFKLCMQLCNFLFSFFFFFC